MQTSISHSDPDKNDSPITPTSPLPVDLSLITASNPLPFTSESTTDLIGMGNIVIGVTEVEIAITGTTSSIRVRADTTNTGNIFIGKTGVLADGTNDFVRLESGDEVIIDYNDTTNALFAISDAAAQKINVGALL